MSRSRGTVRSKREDDILLAAPACWKGCIIVLAVVLTSCFVISSPLSAAHTETTVERLRSLERTLEERLLARENLQRETHILFRELESVKTRLVQAAAAAREQGEMLTQLEQQRTMLERKRDAFHKSIERRREKKARVLMALERLSWQPLAGLTIAVLSTKNYKKKIAILINYFLLRDILRQILFLDAQNEAEMTTIEATHGAVSVKQQGMRLVQQAISDEHRRLHALLRGKTALLNLTASRSHTAARQIRTISQETSSLRDLMAAQLEGKESLLRGDTPRRREAMSVTQNACRQYKPIIAEKTKNNNLYMENSQEKHLKVNLSCGTFSQARGNLPMPTRGRVTTLYGQINDVGLASRGIVISAHSGAQVFASYDGIVVFSGLLRGYGPLLIIEHGEGYHMVLSGMARIDAEMGQHLLVGEPVGVIANIIKPLLYVELRREGHPINPMPWLVACEGGVKG